MENNDNDKLSAIERAQKLRLGRVLGGATSYAVTSTVVVASWLFGYLDGARVVHYLLAVVAINACAVWLIKTNRNLRLRDPSMTAQLIIASLWPAIYVMFHLQEPMVRAAFLLLATVGLLFGALAFDRRAMLKLSGVVVATYLLMLGALYLFAPERLDLRVETILVVAYFSVLVQVSYLGSFIAGMRNTLRDKNAALKKTMAELSELATRDPLTRLPNRRTAMQQLDRELTRSERRRQGNEGLCIGLLDVDHFKLVNDRFGHQAGDKALALIGETLSRTMRQGDFVARFGGEEFLIILPETSLEGGERAVQRMREAVAAIAPQDLDIPDRVTVSIGLTAHDPDQRIEETLGRADQALYRAKHLGRDKVVLWESLPQEEAS